ncbi:MAG: YdiU family protein [Balneolales bacterium]|nr:YdiU family protein [Balneolales bacterium]
MYISGWNSNKKKSYTQLPDSFYSFLKPQAVKEPGIVLFNKPLAEALGLHLSEDATQGVPAAELLSGNTLPDGFRPFAQAYAGHQFGNFTMLGDGRALMLAEQTDIDGSLKDLQFKGSGRTPYSRSGDGRAALSSMLREYVMSEGLHYLGIPATRSLSVCDTGEPVYRQVPERGGILVRVASSHIRTGTFEYARAGLPESSLEALLMYAAERHFPEILKHDNENIALAFLQQVMDRQLSLICEWMRVGFVHGVMNTDNMSIAGETIDFGPCAFMNAYNPKTVFSGIDLKGRYAYVNQPPIAHWNLGCLAGALMPLVDKDEKKAVEKLRDLLSPFPDQYKTAWKKMMCAKIGLNPSEFQKHEDMINNLLEWMRDYEADYTNTFLYLESRLEQGRNVLSEKALEAEKGCFDQRIVKEWIEKWKATTECQKDGVSSAIKRMQSSNPVYIPRNHLVEDALKKASQQQDTEALEQLLNVVSDPYNYRPGLDVFQLPPADGDAGYRTHCNT